jgi:hypothetical protein
VPNLSQQPSGQDADGRDPDEDGVSRPAARQGPQGRAGGHAEPAALGPVLSAGHRIFAWLHAYWERRGVQRVLANGLLVAFCGALVLIELRRRHWLPDAIAWWVPTNHFYAVQFALNLLLGIEVLRLVFGLSGTLGNTMGKQLEILSIILLRHALEELVHFPEPIRWEAVSAAVPRMAVDTAGAVLVFALLGVFYAVQHEGDGSLAEEERIRFTAARELVALVLLVWFTVLAARGVAAGLARPEPGGAQAQHFFEQFYTVLVFSDILVALLSLRHSFTYDLVFRNSGYAAVTVIIRLALNAPPFINVALGVGATLVSIGIAWSYERNAAIPRPPSHLHGRGATPAEKAPPEH